MTDDEESTEEEEDDEEEEDVGEEEEEEEASEQDDEDEEEEEEQEDQEADDAFQPEDAAALELWPDIIDGAVIRQDRHAAGYIHRLVCECTHHANCARRRQTGERQRQDFGKLGPIAYLGAWHSLGRTSGVERHSSRGFQPTLAEQRAWLDAHRAEYTLYV